MLPPKKPPNSRPTTASRPPPPFNLITPAPEPMILVPGKTPGNVNDVQKLLEEMRAGLISQELAIQKLIKITNIVLANITIKETQNHQLVEASQEATKKKGRSNRNLGNARTIGPDEIKEKRQRRLQKQ